MTKSIGDDAERLARQFLQQQGKRIIDTNYRGPGGEIDIIIMDDDILVFVEVRHRRSARFGSAGESVRRDKQQRIIATAQHFLLNHNKYAKLPMRFDLLCLDGPLEQTQISWLKAAFMVE